MAMTGTMLTFQEFEQLPDRPGKFELLRGELIELPPADDCHNEISHEIFFRLKAALDEAHSRGEAQELGKVRLEKGYRLSGDGWVKPDVSVTHAGQRVEKYAIDAPAIAIEVISPSHSAEEMETKTELYFEFGAREVWRFFPKQRHVVVHIGSRSEILTRQDTLRTPLIPGFVMPVAEILA